MTSLLLLISAIFGFATCLSGGYFGYGYYLKRRQPQIADPYKITAMEKALGMPLSYPKSA